MRRHRLAILAFALVWFATPARAPERRDQMAAFMNRLAEQALLERVLDDEMRALDAKMHEAEPKVRAELRALFEQLVAKGAAEPLK